MILHTIYHVNDKGEIEEGIALSEVLLDNETRLGFGGSQERAAGFGWRCSASGRMTEGDGETCRL